MSSARVSWKVANCVMRERLFMGNDKPSFLSRALPCHGPFRIWSQNLLLFGGKNRIIFKGQLTVKMGFRFSRENTRRGNWPKSILWQNEGFDPIAFWVKGVANIELVHILINTQYVITSITHYPVKICLFYRELIFDDDWNEWIELLICDKRRHWNLSQRPQSNISMWEMASGKIDFQELFQSPRFVT